MVAACLAQTPSCMPLPWGCSCWARRGFSRQAALLACPPRLACASPTPLALPQSPIPLFHPSPKKTLSLLASPPSVSGRGLISPPATLLSNSKLAAGGGGASGSYATHIHHSPFAALLDGHSRSSPVHGGAAGAGGVEASRGGVGPTTSGSGSQQQQQQQQHHHHLQRHSAFFGAVGDANYLSPLAPRAPPRSSSGLAGMGRQGVGGAQAQAGRQHVGAGTVGKRGLGSGKEEEEEEEEDAAGAGQRQEETGDDDGEEEGGARGGQGDMPALFTQSQQRSAAQQQREALEVRPLVPAALLPACGACGACRRAAAQTAQVGRQQHCSCLRACGSTTFWALRPFPPAFARRRLAVGSAA